MTHTYIICADGACSGNPGPGGFAWDLWEDSVTPGNEIEGGAGCSIDTTNNIMELRAALESLKFIRDGIIEGNIIYPCVVNMRLDSQYVLKGMFEYLEGWKSKGWKTANKKPVKNLELWKEMDEIMADLKFRTVELKADWVKGHDGDIGNERVDEKAVEMRDLAISDRDNPEEDTLESVEVPELGDALAEALNGINSDQVETMRAILDLYTSGDYSVKDVITQVRQNARRLGA